LCGLGARLSGCLRRLGAPLSGCLYSLLALQFFKFLSKLLQVASQLPGESARA
jgi:hypothetical protein